MGEFPKNRKCKECGGRVHVDDSLDGFCTMECYSKHTGKENTVQSMVARVSGDD